ncbi:glycoside hydrolase family 10 protein [Candidatus Cloacimonadota bacterium]
MSKWIFLIFLIVITSSLASFSKAIWVTSWDLTTPERIDEIIADCKKHDIDQILAEVRYRGDALYFPNRKDSTFLNKEPRSYLLTQSADFDPLEYLIKKGKKTGIEIHAWVTVFVVTTTKVELLPENHIYFEHPEWFTSSYRREVMKANSYEGAYLDPGVPAVHLYLLNVFLDIVKNYDLAGIHFDYIRYPDNIFGYNKIARSYYQYEFKYRDSDNWQLWKAAQVSDFLKKVSISIRNIKPDIALSAAVFPYLETALTKYSQNWYEWLKKGYLDRVYLMAYTTSSENLENLLGKISNFGLNNKIVVGLRAWDSSKKYRTEEINKKIKISRKLRFSGICLFSYSGIKDNGYFKKLKL